MASHNIKNIQNLDQVTGLKSMLKTIWFLFLCPLLWWKRFALLAISLTSRPLRHVKFHLIYWIPTPFERFEAVGFPPADKAATKIVPSVTSLN